MLHGLLKEEIDSVIDADEGKAQEAAEDRYSLGTLGWTVEHAEATEGWIGGDATICWKNGVMCSQEGQA